MVTSRNCAAAFSQIESSCPGVTFRVISQCLVPQVPCLLFSFLAELLRLCQGIWTLQRTLFVSHGGRRHGAEICLRDLAMRVVFSLTSQSRSSLCV